MDEVAKASGKIYLIGAGPGDPKLLTIKAAEAIGASDVIVYDYLVNPEVLAHSRRNAEVIDAGKRAGQPSTSQAHIVQYKQEELRFSNAAVDIAGTLMLPTTKGPHPAVIFVPSSGVATRDSSRFLADLFARRGIAAFIYDKRGAGGSTGDWLQASFDDLAADSLAAIRVLKNRKDINPRQIGLRGQSQGARVAAITASRSKDIAFVILVAPGKLNPEQQELRRVEYEMRRDGFSEGDIREALMLMRMKFRFARTGNEWDEYKAAVEKARDMKWFSYALAPFSKDDPSFRFWRLVNDYEPVKAWEKVRPPVLAILGELDTNTPVSETAAIMKEALKQAGNKIFFIEVLPRAEHTLFVRQEKGGQWKWPRFANGYVEWQNNWLLQRVTLGK